MTSTPDNVKSLQLEQMMDIKNYAADFSQLSEGYIFTRLTNGSSLINDILQPLQFNVMTIFLCRHGSFSIEINHNNYTVEPHSLMVVPPGSLITPEDNHLSLSNIEGDLLFISVPFLRGVNFDISAINTRVLLNERRPVMQLDDREFDLMSRYLELIHEVTVVNSQNAFVATIARSLIAATFYQMLQFTTSRAAREENSESTRQQTRSTNYVREFLQLVRANFRRERSVSFYADRLCISPKYLSLLVKQATGQSASAWINSVVILEAKNLLRYTGKNIQQVAYELNFLNQSSFGKYFKHLTGMSPSEFQRS